MGELIGRSRRRKFMIGYAGFSRGQGRLHRFAESSARYGEGRRRAVARREIRRMLLPGRFLRAAAMFMWCAEKARRCGWNLCRWKGASGLRRGSLRMGRDWRLVKNSDREVLLSLSIRCFVTFST